MTMDGRTQKSDQLGGAFYRVGLLVDQTWWNDRDYSDGYKLASLGLWNDVIQCNKRLSGLSSSPVKPSNGAPNLERSATAGNHTLLKKGKLVSTCRMEEAEVQKALATLVPPTAHKDARWPAPAGVVSAGWPLTNTINDPSCSVSSKRSPIGLHKEEITLQYSIDTMEELMIHRKIASLSIKNVWANDSENIIFNNSQQLKGAVWGPGLNANVPEFYPSVLLPPRQCPPRYSNIFGANYQSEVFPYNDDKPSEKTESEVMKRKKKSRRGTSEQRLSQQMQGVSSSSSPNLLRSGPTVEKLQPRAKQNEATGDMNFWLQTVYPHRMLELSKLGAVARHLERVTKQIAHPFPLVIQCAAQEAPPPILPISERRLYRDVLARKIENPSNVKEESDQSPFDELERQALEQYQSSETCLVDSHADVTSDPVDSKFQDLEREALEQYTDDCENQLNESAYKAIPSPQTSSLTEECGRINWVSKSKQSKKQAKKKKRQLEEDQKSSSNKQHQQEKLRSASSLLLNNVNAEEEIRQLASNLKNKVLNYLRGVDLRITEDNRKTNPKHKDSFENPIQRRIRVSDITDLETYKTYIHEVSVKARGSLLQYFKRIRSEIMKSSSRGMVSFVSPTTCEKRNIRRMIKKCLELKNHADTMNDIPRNLLNCVKREATDTLDLVHHTMEVIYTLSNMSKQASKDVEFLKNGKSLVAELYLEGTTLMDKSAYIKQRVLNEERSVLLVVMFPRKSGLLFDRDYEALNTTNGWSIYMNHDDLRFEHELSLRKVLSPVCRTATHMMESCGPRSVRVNNIFWFPSAKTDSNDIWSPQNWTHVLQVDEESVLTRVTFSSTCRQLEHFSQAALRTVSFIESQQRKQPSARPNLRVRSRRDPPDNSRMTRWESVPSRKRQPRR